MPEDKKRTQAEVGRSMCKSSYSKEGNLRSSGFLNVTSIKMSISP